MAGAAIAEASEARIVAMIEFASNLGLLFQRSKQYTETKPGH